MKYIQFGLACQGNVDHKMLSANSVYYGLKSSILDEVDDLRLTGIKNYLTHIKYISDFKINNRRSLAKAESGIRLICAKAL